jgi:hypothetical protein
LNVRFGAARQRQHSRPATPIHRGRQLVRPLVGRAHVVVARPHTAGVPIIEARCRAPAPPAPIRSAVVRDPDLNLIEISEPASAPFDDCG